MLLKIWPLLLLFSICIQTSFQSAKIDNVEKDRSFKIDYANHQFLKDGQPYRYIAGDFQYFRTHPSQWRDRMKKVRALGLNALQTFIPWNLHEPVQGK